MIMTYEEIVAKVKKHFQSYQPASKDAQVAVQFDEAVVQLAAAPDDALVFGKRRIQGGNTRRLIRGKQFQHQLGTVTGTLYRLVA